MNDTIIVLLMMVVMFGGVYFWALHTKSGHKFLGMEDSEEENKEVRK